MSKGDRMIFKKYCINIAGCIAFFVAGVLSLQGATPNLEALASNSQSRSNFLARTGGILFSEAKGPVVKFVTIQKKVPLTSIAAMTGEMRNILHLPIITEEGKEGKDAQACAVNLLKGTNVAAVVVIYDSKKMPSLLVAPEDRWVLVNVDALGENVSNDALSLRLEKEIWRALGYVMGAANTASENCVLKPVFKPSDLDNVKGRSLSPLSQAAMISQAASMGILRPRPVTYRKACEEGWAPMPTNSFQKAIWDEVKGKK